MLEIVSPITGERLQVAIKDFENKMTWEEARRACDSLGSGWRLPTISELEIMFNELHNNGKGNFSESYMLLNRNIPSYYWSNSEFNINNAWFFSFSEGKAFDISTRGKASEFYVRAVKGI